MSEHASFEVRCVDHIGLAVATLNEAFRFWLDGPGARLVRTGEMGGEFLDHLTGAHGAPVRLAMVSLAVQTIELLEYQGEIGRTHQRSRSTQASRVSPSW